MRIFEDDSPKNLVYHISGNKEESALWVQVLQQCNVETVVVGETELYEEFDLASFDLLIIDADVDAGIRHCWSLRPVVRKPLLLLTSQAEEHPQLRAYEAGVDEYILKPIAARLFLAKINAWLRRVLICCSADQEPHADLFVRPASILH